MVHGLLKYEEVMDVVQMENIFVYFKLEEVVHALRS
ncbi:hypothetical protein C21_02612 [Arenibacter sp. NBRC 103722]|nr:hypothetical protein C21_02612 [Arenibacter sp. NBRC 103722]